VLHPGPKFPAENTGAIPAANQESTKLWYHGSPPPPPQELLTTCGALLQSGLFPSRSVGQAIHWAELVRAKLEQELNSHPLAAIHLAPGAMPIWLAPPSSPTMVPMVCVP